MGITENLNLAYYQQEKDCFCGPACAQMVVDQIGGVFFDQVSLQDQIRSASRIDPTELLRWYAPPDGLNSILNSNAKAAGRPNSFNLVIEDEEDFVSRHIIWTIHNFKVAPLALVYGAAHWIAIKGYEATAAPGRQFDVSYGILGFWINNPYPISTSVGTCPPPLPLSNMSSTTECADLTPGQGTGNIHIDYSCWQEEYMTMVPFDTSWPGKYVAICDPIPGPKESGMRVPANVHAKGEKIIEKEIAAQFANEAMLERGFHELGFLNNILRNTIAGEPMLVHRLDKLNSYYYIVPMLGVKKQIHALVNIDARYGNYRQSCFAPNSENPICLKPFAKDGIMQILGKDMYIKKEKMHQLVFSEDVSVHPVLFWKPCKESLSPFMPFHLVTVGSEQIFVRIDGRMFSSLTANFYGI